MKNAAYLIIIALLAGAVGFLAFERRTTHYRKGNESCIPGQEGCPVSGNSAEYRRSLFALVKNNESDTVKIFAELEKLIAIQRDAQKTSILRILYLRDSLTGTDRERFLEKIDRRFCGFNNGKGMGMRHGRGGNVKNKPCCPD